VVVKPPPPFIRGLYHLITGIACKYPLWKHLSYLACPKERDRHDITILDLGIRLL